MLCIRIHARSKHGAVVQVSSVVGMMYSTVPPGSAPCGCRHLVVQPNSMRKVIRNFATFAEEFQADFENIKAAYAAANLAAQHSSPPFLVATSRPPKLRGGQYEVEIKPLGYEASCTNEQVSMKASRHSLLPTLLLSRLACLLAG